jgi:hypothetical protein
LLTATGLAIAFPLQTITRAAGPDDAANEVEVIPGDQASADPFPGDWQNKFAKGWPADLVAQVIPRSRQFYEVQILDSYGLPGYWDDTGAIYKKEAPKVNMCAPPGQWQSYDINYRGPRFDADGNFTANGRITVDLNGKRIHHDVELPYSKGSVTRRREQPDLKTPGRITLQHHGDPIDFRNIWIVVTDPKRQ